MPASAVELATDGGGRLAFLGSAAGVVMPSGASFVSDRVGWVTGEATSNACSDQSGPLCPWVIDATTDGGRTWVKQMTYTP